LNNYYSCGSVTGDVKSGKSLETPDSQFKLSVRIIVQLLHTWIRVAFAKMSKLFEIFLSIQS